MRLLIVVPAQDRATGNWITATRLQQGLIARGHAVAIHETAGDPAALTSAVTAFRPELVLLLHAWRCGRPWLEGGLTLPVAVLLTGTDVNSGMADPLQAPVIDTVLGGAVAILSQNPLTVAALGRARPELADRLHHLPPGIVLGTTPFPLKERLDLAPDKLLLLCPAGIRPVKGVVELIAMCEPLTVEKNWLQLAFCGPILDGGDYGRRFLAAVDRHAWASWLGVVPPAAIADAMRQADVIVNNSASEGLPNALVEAAALGRPIVAHDIPGNAAVVTDGGNGLLYRDAEGFRAALRRLQDEPALAARLSHPAPDRFSPQREAAALEAICRQALRQAGAEPS
jgi:glycosyltransferase involved in cell wall biosynthesis